MAVSKKSLFGDVFNGVTEAETKIAKLRLIDPRSIPDEIDRQQHAIDYKRAEQERDDSMAAALEVLSAISDKKMPPGHRNIAMAVMESEMRGTVAEREDIIRSGFDIYDGITNFLNHPGEVVLNQVQSEDGGRYGVGLYRSRGLENLVVATPDSVARRNIGIKAVFSGGVRVAINSLGEQSFPEIGTETHDLGLNIFSGVNHYLDPLRDLKVWDPRGGSQPITFLGSREAPRDLSHLDFDSRQRFAIRLAADMADESEWLPIEAPDKEFSETLKVAFADIFADVLMGNDPRDKVKHISGSYSSFTRRTYVETHTQRKKSLADFSREELESIFRAAGLEADDIKTTTKLIIDKANHQNTAISTRAVMQANRDFDSFFNELLPTTHGGGYSANSAKHP